MIKYLLALLPIALAACGGSSTSAPIGRADDDQAVHGGPKEKVQPIKGEKHESK